MERLKSGRVWLVARILLAVSLIPLSIAIWLLADPVENPGVQNCGSPGMFVVTGRLDTALPLPGDADYTPDVPALVAQPTCSILVNDRFQTALWVAGGFGVLALAGAIVGLVDDRIILYRSPRFESFLRERPSDAPGIFWDQPVVPIDDLGSRLPDIEPSDLRTLSIVPAVMWIALVVLMGFRAVSGSFRSIDVGSILVLVGIWLVAVVMVAVRFTIIGVTSNSRRDNLGNNLLTSLATCFVARIRPAFGWSGNWLHQRFRARGSRERALFEVSTLASLSVVVHVAVMFVAGVVMLVSGVERHSIDWRAWLVVVVLAMLLVRGASSSAARYHQLLAAPGPAGSRAIGVLVRRDPSRFAGLVITAVVQCVVEAAGLVVALGALRAEVSVPVVIFVALLATTLGPLGPFTDGIGVVEPVAVLALWRFGVDPEVAVAAVFVWRMAIRWIPMIPGAIAQGVLAKSGADPSA